MKRPVQLLLLSLAVTAAVAFRTREDQRQSPTTIPDAPRHEQIPDRPEFVHTVEDSASRGAEPASREDAAGSLPSEPAARTSWTDPYSASAWDAPGWRFDDGAMTAFSSPATTRSSNSAALPALCTAEFRRDWSSFTAAFRVDLPEESQDGPDAAPRLILEVVGSESRDTLRFTVRSQRAILEHVQGREIVPLREISLAGDEELSILRLSLTPNRLLVRSGRRLLINESRPSGLIGDRCRFRVAAPPGSVISDLRFDGE